MKYFKWLEGERLYLSPINPDDYEIFTKWINSPDVSENLGHRYNMFSLQSEKEFLENMAKSKDNFAIVLKGGDRAEDRVIGSCGLVTPDDILRNTEMGIFIGDKFDRGKGYGTEAIELLLYAGFFLRNFNNIMLRVFTFNQAAVKCYEKCGFKHIGSRRQCYYLNGEYYDCLFMDITQDDYRERASLRKGQ